MCSPFGFLTPAVYPITPTEAQLSTHALVRRHFLNTEISEPVSAISLSRMYSRRIDEVISALREEFHAGRIDKCEDGTWRRVDG